jgi:microcystin-dependent protein
MARKEKRMHRTIGRALLTGFCVLQPLAAFAVELTGVTGGGQPFDNVQPSLALNYFMPLEGIYPSNGGGDAGQQTLGNVRIFAGTFGPGGSPLANGQLLSIAQNTALFSLLGTTYGGNGQTTFALPDLGGRTAIHAGSGSFLLGQTTGAAQTTLTQAQLPAHAHSLPALGTVTGITGGGQPVSNMQPSLGLNYVISTQGVFPSPGGGTGGQKFLGQVGLFAGNFAPGGWAFADGQLLSINQNQALFSLLGTTYGGNGQTTFALPDLRGRTVVHEETGIWDLGARTGAEQVTLTEAQMPAHNHSLPGSIDFTGDSGAGQTVSNIQPSAVLNYLIALEGIYPSREGGIDGETVIGELTLFAGNFAPRGWAFADGQILSIAQNTALFSLLGTTYGGDGKTTFALPDLRGRAVVGADFGTWDLGAFAGADSFGLTQAQLPPHLHTLSEVPGPSVPEPGTLLLLVGALLGLGVGRRTLL